MVMVVIFAIEHRRDYSLLLGHCTMSNDCTGDYYGNCYDSHEYKLALMTIMITVIIMTTVAMTTMV